jgi:ribA/ribD-fused uncharacterized protein
MKEEFTFFWRSESPFSQWYPAEFAIGGLQFHCAEQYMMYCKALLFDDEEIAHKILDASSPRTQKSLGRKVRHFSESVWEEHSHEIVYTGNHAKFTQNPPLKAALLATAGTILVEASPHDRIWGIGLAEDDPRIHDRKQWQGQNRLGEILTRLREILMK